jgi:hypothetical protein
MIEGRMRSSSRMAGDAFKAKLARVEALRSADDLDLVLAGVRKALRDRSNYIVAKAAAIAGERSILAAIPDLLAAYEGLFGDDAATVDPLVLAKTAIAQALKDLDYRVAEPYRRGLAHVQLEKVWGGSEDHAGKLRATCAHALVACDIEVRPLLDALIDHLVDPDNETRAEVVRAVAQIGGDESIVVLRLKALTGDVNAEVLGLCFAALLARDPAESVAFVRRFLDADNPEIVLEAASALAESRVVAALGVIEQLWTTELSLDLRRAIVFSCGASPLPQAAQFLQSLLTDRRADIAATAIAALAASRFRNDLRAHVEETVRQSHDERLSVAFERAFSERPNR